MVREQWDAYVSRIGAGRVIWIALVLVAVSSCVSHQYWLTNFVKSSFEIHVFNQATYMYFETLIWTIVLTSMQFYGYHRSTLTLYDAITIEGEPTRLRWTHLVLQAVLSIVTLVSAQILLVSAFRTLFLIEIMNRFEIDLDPVIDSYASFLNLDYLIFCFVFMDIIILCMNKNYAACSSCTVDRRKRLKAAQESLHVSIIGGIILCFVQLAITTMYSGNDSEFVSPNNLTVDAGRAAPLWLMIFLQLYYVVTDVWGRTKSAGSSSRSTSRAGRRTISPSLL